jgi:hypothetical protein
VEKAQNYLAALEEEEANRELAQDEAYEVGGSVLGQLPIAGNTSVTTAGDGPSLDLEDGDPSVETSAFTLRKGSSLETGSETID